LHHVERFLHGLFCFCPCEGIFLWCGIIPPNRSVGDLFQNDVAYIRYPLQIEELSTLQQIFCQQLIFFRIVLLIDAVDKQQRVDVIIYDVGKGIRYL